VFKTGFANTVQVAVVIRSEVKGFYGFEVIVQKDAAAQVRLFDRDRS
jgi:hypothetical protein